MKVKIDDLGNVCETCINSTMVVPLYRAGVAPAARCSARWDWLTMVWEVAIMVSVLKLLAGAYRHYRGITSARGSGLGIIYPSLHLPPLPPSKAISAERPPPMVFSTDLRVVLGVLCRSLPCLPLPPPPAI